jgi:hypothetical protein
MGEPKVQPKDRTDNTVNNASSNINAEDCQDIQKTVISAQQSNKNIDIYSQPSPTTIIVRQFIDESVPIVQNTDIMRALQEIRKHFGENIFSDSVLFKSVIDDLLPGWEHKTIRKRVSEAVAVGVYMRLQKASQNYDLSKERLRCIKLLQEDGLDEKLSTEIVGAFAMLFAENYDNNW